MATLPQDFREFLQFLNESDVEYLVVGMAVSLISLEDLKANKQASGRKKDLADLEHLP